MIVIDMDMPKDCGKCKLLMQCKDYYYIENKLPDTCPIKCDIEDIKAEIEEMKYGHCCNTEMMASNFAYDNTLEIIDKHTKGADA